MTTATESAQKTVTVQRVTEFLMRYAGVKSLADLAVKAEDPTAWLQERIAEVGEVIAEARFIQANGKGVTLPANLEFGSESADQIAAAICNDRKNNASLKGQAGKTGRRLRQEAKS